MEKFYNVPTQVKFYWEDEGKHAVLYGIAYKDEVICSCCGSVFELEEVFIMEEYEDWVDFSEQIK